MKLCPNPNCRTELPTTPTARAGLSGEYCRCCDTFVPDNPAYIEAVIALQDILQTNTLTTIHQIAWQTLAQADPDLLETISIPTSQLTTHNSQLTNPKS